MEKKVVILSSSSDVQFFCYENLRMFCSCVIVDSWNSFDKEMDKTSSILLILDFELLAFKGISFLQNILCSFPRLRVMVLTATESTVMSVQLLKKGVFDVVTYPCSVSHLLAHVEKAFETDVESECIQSLTMDGSSFSPEESPALLKKFAMSDLPLLLVGESGTGKTHCAQKIFKLSQRKNTIFIGVNCSTIPDTIAESELFGTEIGAFTGACSKKGLFEQAHGGTLFLDEIGELSLAVQAKLLKVIETGVFHKLGSAKEHKVDVRLIFATNCNLELLVKEKKFRNDLFYRISLVQFILPTLETKKSMLPYYTKIFLEELGKTMEAEAHKKIESHFWKGNLRELKNCLLRASVLSDSDVISEKDIVFSSIQLTMY